MRLKILVPGFVITILCLTGCLTARDKTGTMIRFESYNQLENPPGKSSGDDFTFDYNGQRYEVMNGYTANYLQIIEKSEDNRYKLVMADSNREKLFSIITEKEYEVEAVRECTDTDGTVYLFYSKWDAEIRNLFLDDLISSHILQMNMDNYTLQQEYVFPEEVIVLTVHDGYVYTVEDGRIYRSLLPDGTDKECMADLGYRGIPKEEVIDSVRFCTEAEGIVVKMWRTDEDREITAADFKYTDPPMEPNVLRRIHRAVMEEVTME